MNGSDLLSDTVVGRLRLLPAVDRLYPSRTASRWPLHTVTALLHEPDDRDAVTINADGPVTSIEVDVGLTTTAPLRQAGREVAAAARAAVDGPVQVRIRVVAVS